MKGTICCEEKCTACMACANACPKNAIGIGVNKYGYEKVVINDDKCVDCGLCTKVCARRMQIERHSPIKCYAGQSRDAEKLKRSASGAAFQMLAEIVLETGGVCYGCAGEMINGEYRANHIRVTNVDELQSILNSKYILSHIPLLIIQGDEDMRAPLSMAYKLYDSCNGEKQLYIVHGADHSENYRKDPGGYEKIVTKFIEERIERKDD